MKGYIAKYKLKKDFPGLQIGAIFEHREYSEKHPDRGSYGYGVLIFSAGLWVFTLPGQLAKNEEWFEKIEENSECWIKQALKEDLLKQIEEMKKKIEKL